MNSSSPSRAAYDAKARDFLLFLGDLFDPQRYAEAISAARVSWKHAEKNWRGIAKRHPRLSVTDTQKVAVWFHHANPSSAERKPSVMLTAFVAAASDWRPEAPIPKSRRKAYRTKFWGSEYLVTPAVCEHVIGDGRKLLWFQPLNTRPHGYLVRVDSSFGTDDDDDGYDSIDEVIYALIDQFSTVGRETEQLQEDGWSNDRIDSKESDAHLDFPVLSLDSGYSWGVEAEWNGNRWLST